MMAYVLMHYGLHAISDDGWIDDRWNDRLLN